MKYEGMTERHDSDSWIVPTKGVLAQFQQLREEKKRMFLPYRVGMKN